MNYYKMQTKNASAKKPQHWTYVASWLVFFFAPLVMIFAYGFSPYWILVWLIFLFF